MINPEVAVVQDVYKFLGFTPFGYGGFQRVILISFYEKCSTRNALFDVVSSLVDGVLADSSVYLFLSMRHAVHSETFVFKAYLEDQTTYVYVLKYRRQEVQA